MDIKLHLSAEALKAIALEVAKHRDASTQRAPDDYIPHDQWQTGRSVRGNCELARSGAIPCTKVGRKWLAQRQDVTAWVESNGKAPRQAEPSSNLIELASAAGMRGRR